MAETDREPYLRIRKTDVGWTADGQSSFAFRTQSHPVVPWAESQGLPGWGWDGATLEVRNDRYGQVPLYYFERASEICVSTSVSRLLSLGAPPAFNFDAIAVFLRLGTYLGSETAFRSIRALPPGALLRWAEGRLQLTSSKPVVVENKLSRHAAIGGFIDLFRQSIRRSSPTGVPVAVPLSGGRDSRHILFELCAQGHRPKLCITARYFPPGDNGEGEVAAASRVANAVGVPHRVVGPPPHRCEAERKSHIETSYCSLDAAWIISVADALVGEVDLIYDGIGGDVLSAGLFLTEERLRLFRSRQFVPLAEDLLRSEPNERLLATSVRKKLQRSIAIDCVVRELEEHADAPNPVGSFIFWNRTRRHIASHYWMLARTTTVIQPYQDDDVFDFLSGLPAEMFMDHAFHTEAIRLAYPQHAALAFSSKRPVLDRDGDRAAARRFATDTVFAGMRHGQARLAQRRFFLPRLVRCLVDSSYQDSVNWLGPMFLYLLALEHEAGPRSAPSLAANPPRSLHRSQSLFDRAG